MSMGHSRGSQLVMTVGERALENKRPGGWGRSGTVYVEKPYLPRETIAFESFSLMRYATARITGFFEALDPLEISLSI